MLRVYHRSDPSLADRRPSRWSRGAFDALAALFAILTLVAGARRSAAAPAAALADYLKRPDDSFTWKVVEKRPVQGAPAARLELVSQTWRGIRWEHEVLIVNPASVRNPDIALLLIGGDGDVQKQYALLRSLADSAGAVAASLNRVPNQPLFGNRKEDALIAYTFSQYIGSGDQTWPLLFPMVKSAVRAMDAVQAAVRQEYGMKVERFVVGGASKRGWTTWLTGASDPRVQAIAPMVIDMLNMKVQTEWAAQMYGRQSDNIHDYTDAGIIERMDNPRMVDLRGWVDPYNSRARYTMPKLLLLGTDDPYWVVDSLRHYWNELPEPKLVFQTPNAGHDLAGLREARPALAAFFQMVADRQTLPRMTWQFDYDAAKSLAINASLDRPAKAFRLWTSDSPVRDFRKAVWSSVVLSEGSGTNVTGRVAAPAKGFRAGLIEAEIVSSSGQSYKLSTEARVIPDGPPSAGAK